MEICNSHAGSQYFDSLLKKSKKYTCPVTFGFQNAGHRQMAQAINDETMGALQLQ
jgi:hypothetical protein